ncbi:MAG: hypothetical protein WCF75_15785 [Pseudolabrys sp.]
MSPRNAGNTLAEADGTEREIMARLGHKSPQMAAHYTNVQARRSWHDQRSRKSKEQRLLAADSNRVKWQT